MSRCKKVRTRRSQSHLCRLRFEPLESRMLLAAGPEIDVQFAGETVPIGDSVDFGAVQQGALGHARMFTVFNRGNQALTLGNIELPDGFRVKEGLNSRIPAYGCDTFTIEMTSSEPGFKVGDLLFTNNDANENPYQFAIWGEVTPVVHGGADLDVVLASASQATVWNGSTLDFGTVTQYAAGPCKTFQVYNRGDQNLTLSTLAVPEGFRVLGNLARIIAPGRSSVFTILMNTNTAGFRSGTVRFTSNAAGDEIFAFTVQGEVAQCGQPEADVLQGKAAVRSGDFIDFGTTTAGDAPRERTFTVVNTGTRTLTLGALEVPAGFRIKEGLSAKLYPGGRDTFTLEMLTDTAGYQSGVVRFASNDPNENPYEITLSGTVEDLLAGVSAPIAVTKGGAKVSNGQTLSFAGKKDYSYPAWTFTVQNIGPSGSVMKLGDIYLSGGGGFSVNKSQNWYQDVVPRAQRTFTVSFATNYTWSKTGTLSFNYSLVDSKGVATSYSFAFSIQGSVTN